MRRVGLNQSSEFDTPLKTVLCGFECPKFAENEREYLIDLDRRKSCLRIFGQERDKNTRIGRIDRSDWNLDNVVGIY